jgi:hypothetical protein
MCWFKRRAACGTLASLFSRRTIPIPESSNSSGKRPSSPAAFQETRLVIPSANDSAACFQKGTTTGTLGRGVTGKAYALVKTYPICATSGRLGPKRVFGDEQVPEGFYELDWFNPQSNFYLGLHVSDPNESDRILGSRKNPGGDIFLHRNCVTIGCLADYRRWNQRSVLVGGTGENSRPDSFANSNIPSTIERSSVRSTGSRKSGGAPSRRILVEPERRIRLVRETPTSGERSLRPGWKVRIQLRMRREATPAILLRWRL